jgi:hypothetical protein
VAVESTHISQLQSVAIAQTLAECAARHPRQLPDLAHLGLQGHKGLAAVLCCLLVWNPSTLIQGPFYCT